MTTAFAAGLEAIYGGNLHIIHSFSPDSANAKGVALVINKKQANFKGVSSRIIIQGRAMIVTIPWHRNKTVTILNVYAPNEARENRIFWGGYKDCSPGATYT